MSKWNNSYFKFIFCFLLCMVTFLIVVYQYTTKSNFISRFNCNTNYNSVARPDILKIINDQRAKIAKEMVDYKYGSSTSRNYASDLVPENGGNPIRNIIITTWRSGSTFVGAVLNSVPGSYYHNEPLFDFGIVQIKGPPNSVKAIEGLKNMLHCNYTNQNHYLEHSKKEHWVFVHNTRLWEQCKSHLDICYQPEFLNPFCSLFPIQSMKIVRLRLKLAEELLQDPSLNVKILLLVRDPRGTLQSRKHRTWCPRKRDCNSPLLLCEDLASDYYAAIDLTAKYGDRILVRRYEDISIVPFESTKDIFQFFGLDFHHQVVDFLETHTKTNRGGESSTFRNSTAAPFHWRKDLKFKEVQDIQDKCSIAMKLWGYIKAENETHQHEFNPVGEFVLS